MADFSKTKAYFLVLLHFFVFHYSSTLYFREVLENTKFLHMTGGGEAA